MTEDMRVTKRNGELEDIAFDKILNRVKKLGQEVNIQINYSSLVMKVIDQLYDKINTTKIDELTAEQCAALSTNHPDYGILASRVVISNHQKNTDPSFYNVMEKLYWFHDSKDVHSPLVSHELWIIVQKYKTELEDILLHDRDYLIDYFGFKTLERAYLFRVNDVILERIQHMWLRVSLAIHGENIALVKETYDLLSQKYFTHATPTLFNAGTNKQQLSSCYLVAMEDDSLEGIFNTLKDCANISKWAGGIGLHIHNVRANNSLIRGTNGKSTGIVPMLKVFNDTARYVNQGGKRNGSFAIYLEPWHADIEDFLELRKNHGDEEMRARDLFYALWVPDLFMERVKENGLWSLFCPNECPGLADVYGDEFQELYVSYETSGKARKTMNARDLWFKVLDAQMETGTPYLLYKDAANKKSNQKNLGTIKSSNLCVSPETQILTDLGYFEIQSLEGQTINVWNGEEFSETTIYKTGENKELLKVETSDGCVLECTPYHKFYIQNKYNSSKGNANKHVQIVEAQNLKEGDKIIKCDFPVIEGTDDMKNAYTHGFFCGDKDNTEGVNIMDLNEKYDVPINGSLKNKLEWLAGYCDADGTISKNGDNQQLQIACIHKDFLLKIKFMLNTCGIQCKINKSNKEGMRKIPDSNRVLKDYYCQNLYRLLITSYDLQKLKEYGFSPKRLKLNDCMPNRNACQFVKIKRVIITGRKDNTYCFNESKKHAGIFNGIITSQCSEIIQYSDDKETAVCNLASIALPAFVNSATKQFDYDKLHEVTKVVTNNLNRIIDINFYPTPKTERSNKLHRPIGIGVQGLADTFILMDVPFHSDEAKTINKLIFETMYHAALEKSNEIAMVLKYKYLENNGLFTEGSMIYETKYTGGLKYGLKPQHIGAYRSFTGSPASKGILQFDMWNVDPPSDRYDWSILKNSIVEHGIRNSLLLAPMPTASTSQILGYNECFEPLTSNIYTRRTLAGEFIVANNYLMRDLIELGLWNEKLKNNIIANKGSIQHLDMLPQHIRDKYKIVWEIPMKHLIDMAADRGAFICQSQSMNLWLEDPTYGTMTSMHFYSWKQGLKTGIYYLRRKGKHQAQQFTLEPEKNTSGVDNTDNDHDICEMCSA